MKRTLLLISILLTVTAAAKEPWEIGFNSGMTVLHDILGNNWHSNFNGGIEILYPFHKRVPVLLSGTVSHHRPNQSPSPRQGFHSTDHELLMLHFTLVWQFNFFEGKRVQPYLGGGLSTTTFFTSKEWPSPDYSDESEFGSSSVTGIQFSPNERIRLYGAYHFNAVFSSPYIIHFGAFRIGIRLTLPKTGKKNDS